MPKKSSNDRTTTSIKVNKDFWKKVKIHCLVEGIEISDFVEQSLKKSMETSRKKERNQNTIRLVV